MPRSSFAGMTIEALMELRDEVVAQLGKRRAQLEAEIERIGGAAAVRLRGRPPGGRAEVHRRLRAEPAGHQRPGH